MESEEQVGSRESGFLPLLSTKYELDSLHSTVEQLDILLYGYARVILAGSGAVRALSNGPL